MNTVFPHIFSAETILFLNLEIVGNSNSCRKFQLFTQYIAVETIQGRKLYEEIR